MRPVPLLVVATVLTLVPVTILVPGLAELVREEHGGTRFHAHLFMTVNMLTGMVGVPVVMSGVRRGAPVRAILAGLLLAGAVSFVGMGAAWSVGSLLLIRAAEGAVHLPAVTLLMVAANRLAGERRGATLGAIAGSIMIGVAVGGPAGGALVAHGPWAVYGTGALLLLAAAGVVGLLPRIPDTGVHPGVKRYAFDRGSAAAWMPLVLGFMDRFTIGVFVSTFTLYLGELGIGPVERGMLIALFMVPFALLSYPAGRLTDRAGWLVPLVVGNVGFGLVYGGYGVVPHGLLPAVMVASGILSALMYAPNLVLVAELARRGAGEGLFGAFQIAGSLGFLVGPMVGGILVEVTRRMTGEVAYAWIFGVVGGAVMVVGAMAGVVLRKIGNRH